MLRHADVLLSQGTKVPDVVRSIGVTRVTDFRCRRESLNETALSSLREASAVLAAWRDDYSRVRPQSALHKQDTRKFLAPNTGPMS